MFILSKGQTFFHNRNPASVCFADFIYSLYILSSLHMWHLARFQMLCLSGIKLWRMFPSVLGGFVCLFVVCFVF